ncbi:hypothetical protein [Dactylosporangium sp. NPDC051484]|uniref:hypothetical protein n=1 Tax=Dactylosporangium sp. NPDC051484 TaxID=3154942 RepID=UPI00344D0652
MVQRRSARQADLTGCLAELQRRGLVPDDWIAVLCVGSVALGWDNPGSDYDFVVVSTSEWAGDRAGSVPVQVRPRSVPIAVTTVDNRRWEIKFWLDTQVDQVFAKVSHARFESGRAPSRELVDAEELFLERLTTCVPLCGADWVERRQTALARSAFRAFTVTRSLAQADASVEDALGQLAEGDVISAVLAARIAFGHAIDALLESRGRYGSRSAKWRARRFQEANPPHLSFERYWAFETMAGLDPAAPERWVEQVVEVCKNLSLEAEL